MKPVLQTIFGKENGNCFNACIASIFEIPIETIPYYMHEDNWSEKYNEWLIEKFGVYFIDVSTDNPTKVIKGYHLIVGFNPISDCYHSQVGYNGNLLHDPLGKFHELKDVQYTVFIKHFPENNLIETIMDKQLTYGQKAVGLSFNPSNDDAVSQIKQKFADCIDQLNELRSSSESGEVKRMCSVAITEAQTAQMWAVKAITWKD